MKKIFNIIINFFNHWLIAMIVIAVLVTLVTWICGVEKFYIVGIITFAAHGILNILFVWVRELYWFITKTGDFKKKNNDK